MFLLLWPEPRRLLAKNATAFLQGSFRESRTGPIWRNFKDRTEGLAVAGWEKTCRTEIQPIRPYAYGEPEFDIFNIVPERSNFLKMWKMCFCLPQSRICWTLGMLMSSMRILNALNALGRDRKGGDPQIRPKRSNILTYSTCHWKQHVLILNTGPQNSTYSTCPMKEAREISPLKGVTQRSTLPLQPFFVPCFTTGMVGVGNRGRFPYWRAWGRGVRRG